MNFKWIEYVYALGHTPSHMDKLILGKRAGDRLLIITNIDNNKSYHLLNIVVTALTVNLIWFSHQPCEIEINILFLFDRWKCGAWRIEVTQPSSCSKQASKRQNRNSPPGVCASFEDVDQGRKQHHLLFLVWGCNCSSWDNDIGFCSPTPGGPALF